MFFGLGFKEVISAGNAIEVNTQNCCYVMSLNDLVQHLTFKVIKLTSIVQITQDLINTGNNTMEEFTLNGVSFQYLVRVCWCREIFQVISCHVAILGTECNGM